MQEFFHWIVESGVRGVAKAIAEYATLKVLNQQKGKTNAKNRPSPSKRSGSRKK